MIIRRKNRQRGGRGESFSKKTSGKGEKDEVLFLKGRGGKNSRAQGRGATEREETHRGHKAR